MSFLMVFFSCQEKDNCNEITLIDIREDNIVIDGSYLSHDSLVSYYLEEKYANPKQCPKVYVTLWVSRNTNIGRITDIKEELKKANITNIEHQVGDEGVKGKGF